MRITIPLCLVAAACDGADDGGVSIGTLAYTDASGHVLILEMGTGAVRELESPLGPPGNLSLSLDGQQVAFAAEPQLFERHVMVADIATGDVREVQPETGQYMPAFRWGVDRFFWYPVGAGDVNSSWLVTDGATTARRIGGDFPPQTILTSPVDASVAFNSCTEPPTGNVCARELAVESADGASWELIATGPRVEPVAFTPDGTGLIVLDQLGDELRLFWYPREGVAQERDLGVVDGVPFGFSDFADDQRLVSPDGAEVLAIRDGGLVAVSVADGTSRPISAARPSGAVFAAGGAVVYAVEEELPPYDDTPEYLYHLFADQAALDEDLDGCWNRPKLSSSSELVAWECAGGVRVYSVADATLIETVPIEGIALGFDRLDSGLVVAAWAEVYAYDLWYHAIGGGSTLLGTAEKPPGAEAGSPSFDFAP